MAQFILIIFFPLDKTSINVKLIIDTAKNPLYINSSCAGSNVF